MARTTIKNQESIGAFTKTSSTTVSLAASTLNIGPFQHRTNSALTLNTSTTGTGGLDAAIAANRLYYVYAVESNNAPALIGSLSPNGPSGFSQYKLVGHFTLDNSSNIFNTYSSGALDRDNEDILTNGADNYLMNSGFHFFQRTGAQTSGVQPSLPGGLGYLHADRWRVGYNGAGAVPTSWQGQIATFPGNAHEYHLTIQSTPSAFTDNYVFEQRVESIVAQRLVRNFISIGLWIRSTGPQNISISLGWINTKDNFGSFNSIPIPTGTIKAVTTDGSWQYVAWEGIYIPDGAQNGLVVNFFTSGMATIGSTVRMDISRVQLNIGFKAAPWRHYGGSYSSDLEACLRYYEKSYPLDSPVASMGFVGGYVEWYRKENFRYNVFFQVRKRTASPSLSGYNPSTGTFGQFRESNGTNRSIGPFNYVNDRGFVFDEANGNWGGAAIGSACYFHWVCENEL